MSQINEGSLGSMPSVDLPEDADRGIFLVVVAGIVAIFFACVFAGNYGWFASRVPIVENALTAELVNKKLQDAGIARLSRGYSGFTDAATYLAVDLYGGESLYLTVEEWRLDGSVVGTGRRYIINKPGANLEYSGTAPMPNERKDSFLWVIEDDVSLAINAVNQKRAIESAAVKSWR